MEQVVRQASRAISSISESSDPHFIWGALYILTQLKERPWGLGDAAYRWCAVIWRNRHSYEDWEALLLLSLEVGFRHTRPPGVGYPPLSTDAEPNQEFFDAVLKSNNSEAVADLAWASFMFDGSGQLGLSLFANHIVDLRGVATEPFSRDLRQTFVLCVEYGEGLGAFKNVGEERFVELLNCLHIGIEDLDHAGGCEVWSRMLLEIVQSTEEAQYLDIHSWELLAEIAPQAHSGKAMYNPDVTTSLVDGKEWDKLECWMVVVWMNWPPEPGKGIGRCSGGAGKGTPWCCSEADGTMVR